MRSPQTNSAFQKLFGLPPEEFLINDFTCHLKRKMPLQVWLVCYVVLKAMVKYYFDFNWLMFLLYFLIKLLPIVLGRAAYLFQQELLDFMQICLDTRQNSFCFGRTLKTSKSFLLHFHRWAVR